MENLLKRILKEMFPLGALALLGIWSFMCFYVGVLAGEAHKAHSVYLARRDGFREGIELANEVKSPPGKSLAAFADRLKSRDERVTAYVPLKKGTHGQVFYALVPDRARRPNLGEVARWSPQFHRLQDLQLFMKVHVFCCGGCRRMEPTELDPDPNGEFVYAEEK